jgi:hypothetical protein
MWGLPGNDSHPLFWYHPPIPTHTHIMKNDGMYCPLNINVSPPAVMETILDYLNVLAFQHNYARLNEQFRDYPATGDVNFMRMNRELSFAYWEWSVSRNANAALLHLESVGDICRERLSDEYRAKYARCRLLLRRLTSTTPTTPSTAPADARGDMDNLEHLLAKLGAVIAT